MTEELGLDVFEQYEGPKERAPAALLAGQAANLVAIAKGSDLTVEPYVGQIYPSSLGGRTW